MSKGEIILFQPGMLFAAMSCDFILFQILLTNLIHLTFSTSGGVLSRASVLWCSGFPLHACNLWLRVSAFGCTTEWAASAGAGWANFTC